jgi:hypothetical protein
MKCNYEAMFRTAARWKSLSLPLPGEKVSAFNRTYASQSFAAEALLSEMLEVEGIFVHNIVEEIVAAAREQKVATSMVVLPSGWLRAQIVNAQAKRRVVGLEEYAFDAHSDLREEA